MKWPCPVVHAVANLRLDLLNLNLPQFMVKIIINSILNSFQGRKLSSLEVGASLNYYVLIYKQAVQSFIKICPTDFYVSRCNTVCSIVLDYNVEKCIWLSNFQWIQNVINTYQPQLWRNKIAESCYPTVHALQSADTPPPSSGDNETSSKHSISAVVLKVLVKI